jgi:hypothetical protein
VETIADVSAVRLGRSGYRMWRSSPIDPLDNDNPTTSSSFSTGGRRRTTDVQAPFLLEGRIRHV